MKMVSTYLIIAIATTFCAIQDLRAEDIKSSKLSEICGDKYASVSEAFNLIVADPSVQPISSDDTTMTYQSKEYSKIWTFTKQDHKAHPAVVCKQIAESDGTVQILTTILCEAESEDCQALMMESEAIHKQTSEEMREQVMEDLQKELDKKKELEQGQTQQN